MSAKGSLKRLSTQLVKDPLFRNSIFLMLSTVVMGALGFFFWLLNAKLFSTDQIGVATTLISIMSLISTVSLFGFNTVYIRYLLSSEDPNRELNSGLTIVAIVSAVFSSVFVALTPMISPHLAFLHDNLLFGSSFVFFMIVSSLNMITDAVFIAHRRAHYNLIVNSVMSTVKLVLPPFFLVLGSYGIFMAAAIGASIDLMLSLYFIVFRFGYSLYPTIDFSVVQQTFRFFISNYISGLLSILPTLVLPILVLNRLGANEAAFYYIDLMIVNLLYVIPFASAQSLFAEGSYDEGKLIDHAKRAVKLNLLLLVPVSAVLLIGGRFILSIYGYSYAGEGTSLLQIMTVSAAFITADYIYAAIFKVTGAKSSIIAMSLVGTISIIGLSFELVNYGLVGVGLAWLIGNAASAVFAACAYHSRFLQRYSTRVLKHFIA
jgi:O-antigen/teichoic acid export membrane protein